MERRSAAWRQDVSHGRMQDELCGADTRHL